MAPAEAGPGSGVKVTAVGLPGDAKVKLGFGPPLQDYTVIATPVASSRGVVEATVTVPNWAKPGEAMVFTVETEDGRVRLVSEAFPVVAAPSPAPGTAVSVTGTLSGEGTDAQPSAATTASSIPSPTPRPAASNPATVSM